jgi:hypothetical protein
MIFKCPICSHACEKKISEPDIDGVTTAWSLQKEEYHGDDLIDSQFNSELSKVACLECGFEFFVR